MAHSLGKHARFILVEQGRGTIGEGIEWSDGTVSMLLEPDVDKPLVGVDAESMDGIEDMFCKDGNAAVVWDL